MKDHPTEYDRREFRSGTALVVTIDGPGVLEYARESLSSGGHMSASADPPTPSESDDVRSTPVRPRRRLAVAVLVGALAVLAGTISAGSSRPHVTLLGSPPTADTGQPVRRVTELADHPLLAPGLALPAATCELPAFARDARSLPPYYEALILCMDAAWAPVLDAARLPRKLPHVDIKEHPGETGCGDPDEDAGADDFLAMYCSALDTMYLPIDRMLAVDDGRPATHLAVVAHEYAHHVQEESGLLWAAHLDLKRLGWTTPPALETNRRLELQAHCFAALFLAAAADHGPISRALADEAVAFYRTTEPSPTHGTAANQLAWATAGYTRPTTATCNTFTAPPHTIA
jgi:uncharacterized protein